MTDDEKREHADAIKHALGMGYGPPMEGEEGWDRSSVAVLCKDCRHYLPPESHVAYVGGLPSDEIIRYARMHKCRGMPKHNTTDLVTGGGRLTVTDCYVERSDPSSCGPEARWFQPKETE